MTLYEWCPKPLQQMVQTTKTRESRIQERIIGMHLHVYIVNLILLCSIKRNIYYTPTIILCTCDRWDLLQSYTDRMRRHGQWTRNENKKHTHGRWRTWESSTEVTHHLTSITIELTPPVSLIIFLFFDRRTLVWGLSFLRFFFCFFKSDCDSAIISRPVHFQ